MKSYILTIQVAISAPDDIAPDQVLEAIPYDFKPSNPNVKWEASSAKLKESPTSAFERVTR